MDLGPHVLDLCLLFIGEQKPVDYRLMTSICNYEKVSQSGAARWFERKGAAQFDIDVEESAITDVLFEDDTALHVKLSWRSPIEADCTYFNITGTKGRMELKTLFGFSNDRLWKEDCFIWSSEGKEEKIHFDKEVNNTKNAFGEMLSYFVEALLEKSTSFTSYEDAQKIVSLTEKLYGCEEKDEDSVHIRLLEEI